MKRIRKQPGVIITLASEAPDRPVRTLFLSASLLTAIKMVVAVAVLAGGMVAVLAISRSYQLVEQREILARALAQRENQLRASETRRSEMDMATEALMAELGTVGAMVREVQTFAGLEPDAEVDAPVALNRSEMATRFALGGLSGAALAGASADAVGVGLGDLVQLVKEDLLNLTTEVSEVNDAVTFDRAVSNATPRIWPVSGWLSSYFGWRRSPIDGRTVMHKGVDIVAPFRTPVAVTAPGKVVTAGWSGSGYGYHVVVDHGFGFRTLYGHLSEIVVAEGDELVLGDTVGLLGSTGYSTGPHLHYEVVRQDVPVDPAAFLPE